MKKERESNFELLRIIAQFMIIYYHILYFAIYPVAGHEIYKALWFPPHVGVPVFVMISGYFGIRPSIKGLVKYIGLVLVLSIPYMIEQTMVGIDGGGIKFLFNLPFFLSLTPFWFVRTYFFLYLFSPVINKYLKDITPFQRLLLLVVLLYMGVYIGVLGADASLKDGKNLISFLLFYTIGDTLKSYKGIWEKWNMKYLITLYVIFNAAVVLLFSIVGFGRISDAIWLRIFFAYYSPILLINSVWLFVIFGKIHVHSAFINHVGKASLAMYILHGTFLFNLIVPTALSLYNYNSMVIGVLLSIALLTLLIIALCVMVYDMLIPIWKWVNKIGDILERRAIFFKG